MSSQIPNMSLEQAKSFLFQKVQISFHAVIVLCVRFDLSVIVGERQCLEQALNVVSGWNCY